jgi:hypothetical protein
LRSDLCLSILPEAPQLFWRHTRQERSAIIALDEVWLLVGFGAFLDARNDPGVLDNFDERAELRARDAAFVRSIKLTVQLSKNRIPAKPPTKRDLYKRKKEAEWVD